MSKIDNLIGPSPPRATPSRPAGNAASGTAGKPVEATRAVDTVQLSGDAHDLQQTERKARSGPVEDTARVAEIKAAIANGTFRIDAYRVADGVLDSERAFR